MHRLVEAGMVLGAVFSLAACEQPTAYADSQDPNLTTASADGSAKHDGPGRRGRSPLGHLLARAEILSLSAGQISALETIQTDLQAANAPLFEQVRELMGDPPQRPSRDSVASLTPDERAALREQMRAQREENRADREARMEQARPLLEQIRANTEAAAQQALTLLTDEQKASLEADRAERQAEMQNRRGDRQGRGGPPRRGPGGAGGRHG